MREKERARGFGFILGFLYVVERDAALWAPLYGPVAGCRNSPMCGPGSRAGHYSFVERPLGHGLPSRTLDENRKSAAALTPLLPIRPSTPRTCTAHPPPRQAREEDEQGVGSEKQPRLSRLIVFVLCSILLSLGPPKPQMILGNFLAPFWD